MRVFHTPQIHLPSSVKFADCEPNLFVSHQQLEYAYILGNYIPRSMWYTFEKGPTPPPFTIVPAGNTGLTETYSIYFNNFEGSNCPSFNCNLQCATQTIHFITGSYTGSSVDFCINGDRPVYHFDLQFNSSSERLGLPGQFTFTYEDTLGNTYTEYIESIGSIKPAAPIVGISRSNGIAKAYIGVILRTSTFLEIDEDNIVQYIVEKCNWSSQTNVATFKGYKNKGSDASFTDIVATNDVVGYRVKFRNRWNEESLYSDWVLVDVASA